MTWESTPAGHAVRLPGAPKQRGNAFSYDEWGTINGQTWTPGQAATPGTAAPPGPRDANGNYLGPYSSFTYDVENRLVWQPGSTGNYGYDPWGKRVIECCSATDGSTTYTFFDINGKRQLDVGVINNGDGTYQSSTVGTYTYFGRKLLVRNGATVSTDRLGSIRSNSNGEQFSYYPYGRERTSTADGRPKFGTYFRDGILLNAIVQDYADQRYYDGNSGTFWSPDPGGLATTDPRNPVTWNRYLYANGDPINFNDPHGLSTACTVDDEGDADCWQELCDLNPAFCIYKGPVGGGGGGSQGGGSPPTNQMLLHDSQSRVATDLENPDCDKDFKDVSKTLTELSNIGFHDYGEYTETTGKNGKVHHKGGQYGQYNSITKSINLNSTSSINWVNPSASQILVNGQQTPADLIAGKFNFWVYLRTRS